MISSLKHKKPCQAYIVLKHLESTNAVYKKILRVLEISKKLSSKPISSYIFFVKYPLHGSNSDLAYGTLISLEPHSAKYSIFTRVWTLLETMAGLAIRQKMLTTLYLMLFDFFSLLISFRGTHGKSFLFSWGLVSSEKHQLDLATSFFMHL